MSGVVASRAKSAATAMHVVLLLADLGAVLMLVLAAMRDVIARRISNSHVCVLLACAFVAAIAEHRVTVSVVAALIVFGLTLAMWLPGLIGGADAKLLTASSLLLAPGALPSMILCIAVAGGVLCLPYLPGGRLFPRPAPSRPAGLLRRALRCEQWRLRRRGPLPYAVAIAAGTIFTLVHGS
jgi:prepilin peptidase CpaA